MVWFILCGEENEGDMEGWREEGEAGRQTLMLYCHFSNVGGQIQSALLLANLNPEVADTLRCNRW